MKTMIKLVIALISAAAFMGSVARAEVLAAWDLSDKRITSLQGWTTVSKGTLDGGGSEVGDLILKNTGGSLLEEVKTIHPGNLSINADQAPIIPLVVTENTSDQDAAVYRDFFRVKS